MSTKAPILQDRLNDLSKVRTHTPRGPLIVLLALLAAAIGAAWIVTAREYAHTHAAWRDLRRSQQAAEQTGIVLSLVQGAETGQRGYVLTGDPAFLTPYRDGVRDLEQALARLDEVAGPDPAQAERMARLRVEMDAKLVEMALVIRVRQALGEPTAAARIARGSGKAEMDAIRSTLGELHRAELAEIQAASERYQASSAAEHALSLALMAALALFVLTVGVASELMLRWKDRVTLDYVAISLRRVQEFEEASDGIVVLNSNGGVEAINAAAEQLFDRQKNAIGGLHINDIMDLAPPGDAPFLARLEATHGPLKSAPMRELTARRPDGEEAPVNVTVRAMHMTDGLYIGVYARDISDRKRVERLKDEFVSTVSHELRTPLTSIAGSLGLLAGGMGDLPPGPTRLIGIAHANCQRLIRLINDMLDVEKIESGKMKFDMAAVTLAEAARRSIDSVRGYADQLGVEIRFQASDDDLCVRADIDRLVQVGANLISNALKFSKAGDRVEISMLRRGRVARLSVTDHGPGIPDEFRARIFTKFAQADSSDTRQKGGTGLGLVIAKEIVDRHGGRLWFESEPGQGAQFHVDLPLVDDAVAPEANGPRLLVCEDDADVAEVLRQTLVRDGFSVDVVGSVADALAALSVSNPYRALVLDLVLPDGDGVALIQALRVMPGARDLPIVVVSAEAERGRDALAGVALNVVDWMEKPVDLVRLRRAVIAALARSSAERPLILHVDDDPDILHVTAAALTPCGEIASAESLAAARAFLAERTPDLVILDLTLGDGSGLELLAELNDRQGQPIPVLVFSAQDTDQLILKRVALAMTKSKTSLTSLADAVRRLIEPPAPKPATRRLAS
ncbi:MAG TPA: CHASE3 domain-containing protein [Caulobacteraceae bacterium]|jgi:PAS domain S-box-containing protein|nr:CHASE3 domain-containing protein [Caulobacteraceae bacterium]